MRPLFLASRYRNAERGSAILWILIAIVLFAALGFAMTQGSRSSTSMINDEKARLLASEIIAYAEQVREAVQTLRIKGCSETEISFENSTTGWDNPNAPPDESCHVYEGAGGGLNYEPYPPEAAVNAAHSGTANYRQPVPQAGYQYHQIGTTANDLALQLKEIRREVCIQINNILGIDNPNGEPPLELNTEAPLIFVGTYGSNVANAVGNDFGSGLGGKMVFCRQNAASPARYEFSQILIIR